MHDKLEQLKTNLAQHHNLAVAFSGGVDSTFLLAVAHEMLGENVLAITADTIANPASETDATRAFCQQHGIRQEVFTSDELNQIEGFDHNPENRCYLCKHNLFSTMISLAQQHGITTLVEGSNTDDANVYRPGKQALAELGVASPLLDAGLSKDEIRALSAQMNLPTATKQSYSCLYTRFAYGQLITPAKLKMVEDAEALLVELGFSPIRVRMNDEHTARIEVSPKQFHLAMRPENRELILARFKELGFTYITLDLQGFRSGSMDEIL